MNALVYVDIRKNSKMLEMKNEKNYMGFLINKMLNPSDLVSSLFFMYSY